MKEMSAMQELIARAESIARHLKDRGETVVVAESSTGGLISAALLALPGASAYFLGGAVVYTQVARRALLDLPDLGAEHARLDRALCAAVGANRAATLRGELGAGRERSHRAERQSLRRSGRPYLHRRGRSGRAVDHARNRQCRPRRQHASLQRRRTRLAAGCASR